MNSRGDIIYIFAAQKKQIGYDYYKYLFMSLIY